MIANWEYNYLTTTYKESQPLIWSLHSELTRELRVTNPLFFPLNYRGINYLYHFILFGDSYRI